MKPCFAVGVFVFACVIVSRSSRGADNSHDYYTSIASHVVKLREIARVVERDRDWPNFQRVTLIGELIGIERPAIRDDELRIVVIDYTIDLATREAGAKAHAARDGDQSGGRPFMFEPDPPLLGENKEFWAYLAPRGGRLGNVNRYAGCVVNFDTKVFSGPVFVPVAGQYSFEAVAVDEGATATAPSSSADRQQSDD